MGPTAGADALLASQPTRAADDGVCSQIGAAALAVLPYERSDSLSDQALVAQYVVRPQNAVEAFGMAGKASVQVRARAAAAPSGRVAFLTLLRSLFLLASLRVAMLGNSTLREGIRTCRAGRRREMRGEGREEGGTQSAKSVLGCSRGAFSRLRAGVALAAGEGRGAAAQQGTRRQASTSGPGC